MRTLAIGFALGLTAFFLLAIFAVVVGRVLAAANKLSCDSEADRAIGGEQGVAVHGGQND